MRNKILVLTAIMTLVNSAAAADVVINEIIQNPSAVTDANGEVPAGGFLVLAANADSGSNGGVAVDYEYGGGFFLSNSGDELILEDLGATEIDRVEWDNGATFPDPNGASMSLRNPTLDNNVGANWCESNRHAWRGQPMRGFGCTGDRNQRDHTKPLRGHRR